MKKIFTLLLIAVSITIQFSCSKNNDNDSDNINLNLIYGKWYEIDKCQEQNTLTLNNNSSYVWDQSNNVDCSNNEFPTIRETGTYSVNGAIINFNRVTSETIIEGDSNPEIILRIYVQTIIISVLENNLILDVTYLGEIPGTSDYTVRYRFEK